MPNLRVADALDAGRPVFGTFLKIYSPALVELIGRAGFDFIIVDSEHGNFTHEQIENLIRAAEVAGIGTIVRTPDARETDILHALDSGASGVQIPSLRTARDAEAAMRHARYHPKGQRGFARANRAAAYGKMPLTESLAIADRALVIVHVENREMLDQVESLSRVEGIDVLFFGAADLGQSLGILGQADHPQIHAAFDRVVAAAQSSGRQIGAVAGNAEELAALAKRGIRFLVWQSDIAIIRAGLENCARHFAPLR